MTELERLLERERIKNKQERDNFIKLFKPFFQGKMLVKSHFTMEYENDKFYLIAENFADEDSAGFYSKKEITFMLARLMYKELS